MSSAARSIRRCLVSRTRLHLLRRTQHSRTLRYEALNLSFSQQGVGKARRLRGRLRACFAVYNCPAYSLERITFNAGEANSRNQAFSPACAVCSRESPPWVVRNSFHTSKGYMRATKSVASALAITAACAITAPIFHHVPLHDFVEYWTAAHVHPRCGSGTGPPSPS